ncbi:MAG TPA: hypothetical protein VLK34_09940 [Nocardioidaceae bacterium]|nr:hypothetical protein [Nocardioidaceae bacterium]
MSGKTPYLTLAVLAVFFAVMVAIEGAAASDDGGGGGDHPSEYGSFAEIAEIAEIAGETW